MTVPIMTAQLIFELLAAEFVVERAEAVRTPEWLQEWLQPASVSCVKVTFTQPRNVGWVSAFVCSNEKHGVVIALRLRKANYLETLYNRDVVGALSDAENFFQHAELWTSPTLEQQQHAGCS